ncbi:hypothetical protein J7J18_03380 [bacterium]|nr:hypothetical protein [bacterium]
MISFACFSPHPPILLPNVGSPEDRARVKNTISSLEELGEKLKKENPDLIIISSPHPDWGFNVPLYFLAKDFKGEIERYLMGADEPEIYFEKGREIYNLKIKNLKQKIALIASGDMSHCLKEDGPYGFHPDGPKYDKEFIELLKKKDIKRIFRLDNLYPQAGECGLRSFCFLLGILEGSGINWQPEILSYEGPFGVGYLVVNFKLRQ